MAAVFTVALGYGILLPTLPFFLTTLLGDTDAAAISWHTGMLTGVYMFALFLFSPAWGAFSDRVGRRPVILLGLAGYLASLALFGAYEGLWFAYLARMLAGAFASAVLPVTSAYISDTSPAGKRVRWFALMNAAVLAGFLIGPAISGWVNESGTLPRDGTAWLTDPATLPFVVSGLLGIPLWGAMYFLLPEIRTVVPRKAVGEGFLPTLRSRSLIVLLALNMLVTFGLGSFEVGITLEAQQTMGLSPSRISIMFMECSLVMVLIQGLIFFYPGLQRLPAAYVVLPGFLAMAAGFALLPISQGFYMLLFSVGLIAAGSGALLPVLTHLVSLEDSSRTGQILGLQTAAASLGQGLGSVAGGWLFGALTTSSFWITAGIMCVAVLLATGAERERISGSIAENR